MKKIIMLVISVILIVGVTFAGFLYTGSKKTEDSFNNIIVSGGDASDMRRKIKVELDPSDNTLAFDAKADDKSGRLQYKDGASEDLTVKINITLEEYNQVDPLKINISDSNSGLFSKGYVAVDESTKLDLTAEDFEQKNENGKIVFKNTSVITFKWGNKFNNLNPGIYFDEDESGKAISTSEMVNILNDFKTVLEKTQIVISVL